MWKYFPEKFIGCKRICGFVLLWVLINGLCHDIEAQDPQRFAEDVAEIQQKYDTLLDSNRDTYVFTGSSSIRLWENLEDYFPEFQIVNSGFGGSQTSDLLAYMDPLILNYYPRKVFLYEGDNDINDKKKPKEIIRHFENVIAQIKTLGTANAIVIISAKPSIERWHLKGKYRRLNRKFQKLCETDPVLKFADVWTPMLNGRKLRKELFIDDGLHMNDKGYDIWYEVLKEFVN